MTLNVRIVKKDEEYGLPIYVVNGGGGQVDPDKYAPKRTFKDEINIDGIIFTDSATGQVQE